MSLAQTTPLATASMASSLTAPMRRTDLSGRPTQVCWECACSLGVPSPPPSGEVHACRLICPECGESQVRMVWIADVAAAAKVLDREAGPDAALDPTPPLSERWPDDPEEERLHGPTRENYRFGWKP